MVIPIQQLSLICALFLIAEMAVPSLSICSAGEVRLRNHTTPSHLEGRVELCFNNFWQRVCGGGWDNPSMNVTCRQLGLLPMYPRPGSAEYGAGNNGGIVIGGITCLGHEETLFGCGFQRPQRCSNDAVARCREGVPPNDLMYDRISGDGIMLTWSPPDDPDDITLNLTGYTVTCNTATLLNSISLSLPDTTAESAAITGLRLTESNYECCVFAEFQRNYRFKTCIEVTSNEEPTSEPSSTQRPTTNEVPGSTTTREDTEDTDDTTETTMITSQDPNMSESTVPAALVAAGVLGTMVALLLLLLLLLLLCMFCVVLKHRRSKTASVHFDGTREQEEEGPDGEIIGLSSQQPHAYEAINDQRLNSNSYSTPKASGCEVQESSFTAVTSKPSVQKDPRDLRPDNQEYEDVDIPGGSESHLTVGKEAIELGNHKYELIAGPRGAEQPLTEGKQQEKHQYEVITDPGGKGRPPAGRREGDSCQQYTLPTSSKAGKNHNYAVLDGSTKLESVAESDADELKRLKSRYEFAPDPNPYENTGKSLSADAITTKMPSSKDQKYVNQATVLSQRYEFSDTPIQQTNHSAPSLEPATQTHYTNSEKEKSIVYINLQATDSETDQDSQRQYTHIDPLGMADCDHSYSHINLAESPGTHRQSRADSRSQGDLDTSHSYSHINTASPGTISPGYFPLDTSHVRAKSERSLLLSPKTAQQSRGNAYVLTNKVAKGYSHLDVSGTPGETQYVEVVDLEDSDLGGNHKMIEAGSEKEQNQPKNNNGFTQKSQTTSHGYSLLDTTEVEKMKHAQQDVNVRETCSGEVQNRPKSITHTVDKSPATPHGYSHLDTTEIEKLKQDAQQDVNSVIVRETCSGEVQNWPKSIHIPDKTPATPHGYSLLDVTEMKKMKQDAQQDLNATHSHLDASGEQETTVSSSGYSRLNVDELRDNADDTADENATKD